MRKNKKLPQIQSTPVTRELVVPMSLNDIRDEALKSRTLTEQTIAGLEAWRAEIESTIAFLRGRKA